MEEKRRARLPLVTKQHRVAVRNVPHEDLLVNGRRRQLPIMHPLESHISTVLRHGNAGDSLRVQIQHAQHLSR